MRWTLVPAAFAGLLTSVATAQAAPITDSLVAWWEFESINPGNTITDLSGVRRQNI
jgi:hypothetical protein